MIDIGMSFRKNIQDFAKIKEKLFSGRYFRVFCFCFCHTRQIKNPNVLIYCPDPTTK